MISEEQEHAQLTRLFLAAVDLAPHERRAFLEGACEGDAALMPEVESLLHLSPSEVGSVGTGSYTSLPVGAPPECIGPYKILNRLGQGGMGVVYRAERVEQIRRQVALKLVRTGLEGPELLARFEGECMALAALSHPNIARLYDVGATEEGRPYLAMEYVEGVGTRLSLAQVEIPSIVFCAGGGRWVTSGRSSVSLRC